MLLGAHKHLIVRGRRAEKVNRDIKELLKVRRVLLCL